MEKQPPLIDLFLFIHPEAIRIPTVSISETEINTTALLEFDRLLRKGKAGDEHRFVFHASRGCVVYNGIMHMSHDVLAEQLQLNV